MSSRTESAVAVHRHIIIRIAGYLTLLLTYYHTLTASLERVKVQLPLHPELQKRLDFNLRYITIWNVLFQITYAILALICDLTSLFNVESIIPGPVRRWRYKLFSTVLFPLSFGIVTFFWPIYSVDRELIYPAIGDLVVTKQENLLYHFGVLIYVFLEATILPKKYHKRTENDLKFVFGVLLSYIATTLYTGFVDMKIFPYDILNVTLGTIWFPIILVTVPCLYILGYYVQWWFRDLVWKARGEYEKIE